VLACELDSSDSGYGLKAIIVNCSEQVFGFYKLRRINIRVSERAANGYSSFANSGEEIFEFYKQRRINIRVFERAANRYSGFANSGE
jgi:hypothetical protein